MNEAWVVDIWVFIGLILWSLALPRNEWMGNSLAVLGGMTLVLWYQPVMPQILMASEAAPLNYPLHRLVGFLLLICVLWVVLQGWEDIKQSRKEKQLRKQVPPGLTNLEPGG